MLRRVKLAVIVWCVVCPVRLIADKPAGLLDPPQGRFSDEWMVVELGGKKVGYSHSTMTRHGDSIATHSLTVFKIGRAGQTVDISLLQSTGETLGGEPLSFDSITKTGMFEMRSRGVIDKGQVHVTSSQFGAETEQALPFPSGAKMAWGLFRSQIEHGLKPGTTYQLQLYEPSMSTEHALKSKIVVGDRTKIDVLGTTYEAVKVTTTMATPQAQVESLAYVDDQGSALRVEVMMAGMNMTMLKADKKTALANFSPPEFFINTLVKVGRSIDRQTAQHIRYTLHVSGMGRRIPDLPTTAMQIPGERTAQSAHIDVRRIDRRGLKKIVASTPPAGFEEFLDATPTLNTKDEAVIRMAAEAAGDETRPYFLADKLRRYVTDVIKIKNLNVGFATAGEVCRRRTGDCTEHSVLLAALGRARGLPSRVVVGLAYVPSFKGSKNVFGFHMWTQFYIGGEWVDFDAALRESDCSPARIALATSSLKDAAIGDLAFAIMDIVTGLKIDIDTVESR